MRSRLTESQAEDLAEAVLDGIHMNVQLYAKGGRRDNGGVLDAMRPFVEAAIRQWAKLPPKTLNPAPKK